MYTFNDKPFDVNAHCPYNEITQHREVTIASKQHTAVDFKGDLLAGGGLGYFDPVRGKPRRSGRGGCQSPALCRNCGRCDYANRQTQSARCITDTLWSFYVEYSG
jgi:hypothetical protein